MINTTKLTNYLLIILIILMSLRSCEFNNKLEKIVEYTDKTQAATRGTEYRSISIEEKLDNVQGSLSNIESNTDR